MPHKRLPAGLTFLGAVMVGAALLAGCGSAAPSAARQVPLLGPATTAVNTAAPTWAVPGTSVPATTAPATTVPPAAVNVTVRSVHAPAPVVTTPSPHLVTLLRPTPAPSTSAPSRTTRCGPDYTGAYGADPNAMANTGNGTQLITVSDPSSSSTSGKLTAWDKTGGCWAPHSFPGQPAQPFRAETGYGGIRPYGNRVSGDGSTPQGFFGFEGTMYGVSPNSPNGRYGYQHLVCGDWWDEQPGSPTYDTFQPYPCGVTPPFAGDSEHLWTETVAYQHFAVLALPHPPENASGIFLHDYTNSGVTAGCIALPPGELDAVLGWMNPAADPGIAIGTTGAMNGL